MSEHATRTELVGNVEVTVQVVEGHDTDSAPIPLVHTATEDRAARTVEVAVDPIDPWETVVCASPEAADQWDSRMWNNTRHT